MAASGKDQTALVTALVAGDRSAFETIYRKHNASMVRVAASMVQSRGAAEEVAQDAWLAVLRGINSFEGRASLSTWIFAILINTARTRAKRDGRAVSFDAGGPDENLTAAFDGKGRWKNMPSLWDELTPERILAGRSVMTHVNEAIDMLPAGQRSVIIMHAQHDMTAADVCAALNISEGNMRVLLHRARLAIRATLDELQ